MYSFRIFIQYKTAHAAIAIATNVDIIASLRVILNTFVVFFPLDFLNLWKNHLILDIISICSFSSFDHNVLISPDILIIIINKILLK
jgi:hypothetical protein